MKDAKEPPDPTSHEGKGGPEVSGYPRVFEVNDRLTLRVGFRDSRMVVSYHTRVPLVGIVDLVLEPQDVPLVEKVLARQRAIKALPAAKRKAMKPEEIRLSKRTVAKVAFEDNRVELAVSLVLTTYRIQIKDEEAPRVEGALTFAKEWSAKPEVERFLEGAE